MEVHVLGRASSEVIDTPGSRNDQQQLQAHQPPINVYSLMWSKLFFAVRFPEEASEPTAFPHEQCSKSFFPPFSILGQRLSSSGSTDVLGDRLIQTICEDQHSCESEH